MDTRSFTLITGKQETHGGAASATKERTYYSVLGPVEGSVTPEQVLKHVQDSRKEVSGNGVGLLFLFAVFCAIVYWLISSDIEAGFFLLALIGGAIVIFCFAISNLVKASKQKKRVSKMSEGEIVKTFAEEAAIRNVQMDITKTLPKSKDVTVHILAFEIYKAAKGIFEENKFAMNDGLLPQLRSEMQSAAKIYVQSQKAAETKAENP